GGGGRGGGQRRHGREGLVEVVGHRQRRPAQVLDLAGQLGPARVVGRAGTVVVPDFLALAAPTLAAVDPDGGDPIERVLTTVAELAVEGTELWMSAVTRAEEHLLTWQDELPFGRPLA
ncbi:MAG: hypothetical protein M3Z03_17390, partial [Actinomycetota bacterium]|nr:hypothetical protein [Actinomycetota bacterium]